VEELRVSLFLYAHSEPEAWDQWCLYESRLAELFFGVLEFFVDLCEKVKFVQREVALRFWSGCLQMRNSLGCDCAWFGQLEQKVELGALSLKKTFACWNTPLAGETFVGAGVIGPAGGTGENPKNTGV